MSSPEHQPPDAITFRLQLTLFYRNNGSKPLILPTSEDPTLILSRSLEDVGRRTNQFEIQFRERRAPDSGLAARGVTLKRPREPYFQVIPPGEEGPLGLREYVVLQVHNPSSKQAQTELLGQKIFLQLELDHLRLPEKLAQDLADRWRQYGDLWVGKVRSEAMEFDIPASPEFADCSREYKIDN